MENKWCHWNRSLLGSDVKSALAERTSDPEMEHETRQIPLQILATFNAFPTEERKNDLSGSFINLDQYSHQAE